MSVPKFEIYHIYLLKIFIFVHNRNKHTLKSEKEKKNLLI